MSSAAQPSDDVSPERYVVLARRYRPTQFDGVVGQQHVTRTLQNAIRAGRVHHAYLFTGSRGVGKTTVARILARALNHPDGPTADPPPAGGELGAQLSVDIIEIDGASHTGVDDVRELRESVRYLPSASRYKIYIIDEVHMLSTSAFNALLKTLEEPPAHVVFVFATTEPHKIPATILSRCQRFDFKRVAAAELVDHMRQLLDAESVNVEHAGLQLIARAAEGSVRDALSLLDQVIAYCGSEQPISAAQAAEVLGVADRRVLFDLSRAVVEREAGAALDVVDRLFRDGHDLSQFANAFVGHLRDLVVASSCDDPAPLVDASAAELEQLRQQAAQTDGALLRYHFDRFARAAEEVARSSFPRLLLEIALIEMVQAEPLLPLGDLLDRLEQLEQRLGGGAPPPGRPPSGRQTRRSAAQRRAAPTSSKGSRRAAPPEAASDGAPASVSPNVDRPAGASAAERAEGTDTARRSPDHRDALPLQPGEPLERWQQLLKRVARRDPPLASTFHGARLLGWTNGNIELGYLRSDWLQFQRAADDTRRANFERLCAEQLGAKVRVDVRELTADEESSPQLARQSALEASEQRERSREEKLRTEAREHPLTRALLEQFGATIQTISTERDGSALD